MVETEDGESSFAAPDVGAAHRDGSLGVDDAGAQHGAEDHPDPGGPRVGTLQTEVAISKKTFRGMKPLKLFLLTWRTPCP